MAKQRITVTDSWAQIAGGVAVIVGTAFRLRRTTTNNEWEVLA